MASGVDVRAAVTVNGQVEPVDVPVHTTALDWLRSLGLTGAKEGCAEGECGACSILVARPDGDGSRWTALNACLLPALALDGQEVVTAEGLGSPDALHPVQRELAERGGSQCGYCTPGFVCSMAAEFYRPGRDPDAGADTVDRDWHLALSGNLCRCTGYRPIVDAARALGRPDREDELAARCAETTLCRATRRRTTPVSDDVGTFVRPATLTEALEELAEHPDAVVVAGSTDLGVEVNLRALRPPYVVAIDALPELRELHQDAEEIRIGAALSLEEVERGLAGRVPLLDQVFPQFASRLIRGGATVGGNLGTASPIGDLAPALLALEARVVLVSTAGERRVPVADYFTGYRETVRRPGELIAAVTVSVAQAPVVAFHKIAKRRYDDISSVAIGFSITVVDGVVTKARIGLGGVAATPIRALATESALEGNPWSAAGITPAAAVLAGEGTPIDDMRASARYRRAMLGTALPRLLAGATEQGSER